MRESTALSGDRLTGFERNPAVAALGHAEIPGATGITGGFGCGLYTRFSSGSVPILTVNRSYLNLGENGNVITSTQPEEWTDAGGIVASRRIRVVSAVGIEPTT